MGIEKLLMAEASKNSDAELRNLYPSPLLPLVVMPYERKKVWRIHQIEGLPLQDYIEEIRRNLVRWHPVRYGNPADLDKKVKTLQRTDLTLRDALRSFVEAATYIEWANHGHPDVLENPSLSLRGSIRCPGIGNLECLPTVYYYRNEDVLPDTGCSRTVWGVIDLKAYRAAEEAERNLRKSALLSLLGKPASLALKLLGIASFLVLVGLFAFLLALAGLFALMELAYNWGRRKKGGRAWKGLRCEPHGRFGGATNA